MTNDFKQLADIMVDWCGDDLIRLGHDRPVKAEWVAEEAIRCLLFTIGQSEDARRLLLSLMHEEFVRVHASRQDLDDAGAI